MSISHKCGTYNVRSQLQRSDVTSSVSNYFYCRIYTVVFDRKNRYGDREL